MKWAKLMVDKKTLAGCGDTVLCPCAVVTNSFGVDSQPTALGVLLSAVLG